MDLQILISILWLSCSVQGQKEPDVIITSSEPSIGKVSKSFVVLGLVLYQPPKNFWSFGVFRGFKRPFWGLSLNSQGQQEPDLTTYYNSEQNIGKVLKKYYSHCM